MTASSKAVAVVALIIGKGGIFLKFSTFHSDV
jgi:hypothetical protein